MERASVNDLDADLEFPRIESRGVSQRLIRIAAKRLHRIGQARKRDITHDIVHGAKVGPVLEIESFDQCLQTPSLVERELPGEARVGGKQIRPMSDISTSPPGAMVRDVVVAVIILA